MSDAGRNEKGMHDGGTDGQGMGGAKAGDQRGMRGDEMGR